MGLSYLKGVLASALIFFAFQFSYAQQSARFLDEVIVPGVDTTLSQMVLGSYDYHGGIFERFDTLAGSFTNDALIDEDTLYINSGMFGSNQNVIYKYYLPDRQLIDTIHVKGVTHFEVKGNYLIVSKGFPQTSNFMDIYDKRDLSLLFSGNMLDNFGSNIAITGNTAYVGRAEAFSNPVDTTKIFSYDLPTQSFNQTIVLDTFVEAVNQLYTDGGFLYAIGNGYLTSYDLAMDTFATQSVSAGSDCFGDPHLGMYNGKFFYATPSNQIFEYDLSTRSESLVNNFGTCFSTGRIDTLNDQFVVTTTDFASIGKVFFVDRATGTATDSFALGHSNEALALRYSKNYAPMAAKDYDSTKQGQSIKLDVLANDSDPDGDSLTLSIVSAPVYGTASDSSGIINYTANGSFVGYDTLLYQICDVSPSTLCDTASAVIMVDSLVTGIQNTPKPARVDVYPNPATSQIQVQIQTEHDAPAKYRLMSLTGRLIRQGVSNTSSFRIDVRKLSPGMYLLQTQQEQRTTTRKIVID